ncbi:MAG TPA: acetate kinase [Rubrobacteraceae bacterium]|nr:acetate kinase [Rubrobacteraceae bacterium]
MLAINCGSSSLKFRLSETPVASPDAEETLAWGSVEGMGRRATVDLATAEGSTLREAAEVADHGAAVERVLGWLGEHGLAGTIEAVGHRVVDGGSRFAAPTRVDDDVVAAIEELGELAPLHNGPALAAIGATRDALGPAVPMVATFDTTFHRQMPEKASRYAIPPELAERHGAFRYGFHGLAHRYMAERYAEITSTSEAKLVTLQLGNGCSAAAIRDGRSVDTSMGLTPLEGLMMGTRSGDVDPSLAAYLARRESVEVAEVVTWLNKRSGLLGLSGTSRDMRELLAARNRGDGRAALAVEMFCYRVKKQIGAYLAALGGADAVVFAGGIGERAFEVRAEICSGMQWCGLVLDPERNAGAVGEETRISADDSSVAAYVIPVDEAAIIARDTVDCLLREGYTVEPAAAEREQPNGEFRRM